MSVNALPKNKAETSRKDPVVALTEQRDAIAEAIDAGNQQIAEYERDFKKVA